MSGWPSMVAMARRAHSNCPRELAVELPWPSRGFARNVTARRPAEAVLVAARAPLRRHHRLVHNLTALTGIGGEPVTGLEVAERL